MDKIKSDCSKSKFVTTMFGRHRKLAHILSKNPRLRAKVCSLLILQLFIVKIDTTTVTTYVSASILY